MLFSRGKKTPPAASLGQKFAQIFNLKCCFFGGAQLFLTGGGRKGLKSRVTSLSAPPVSVSVISEGVERWRRVGRRLAAEVGTRLMSLAACC